MVLAKVFDLKCTVGQILEVGDPIIEYEQSATATEDGLGGEGTAGGGGGTEAGGADGEQTSGGAGGAAGEGASAAAAGAGHRKNLSSTGSGETLEPVPRHHANASIGSNVE